MLKDLLMSGEEKNKSILEERLLTDTIKYVIFIISCNRIFLVF